MAKVLLLSLLLPHLCCADYPALSQACTQTRHFVQHRRRAAGRRLAAWWHGRRLSHPEHLVWTHAKATKRTLIRQYMARYPDEHVDGMIRMFPSKLQRPELAHLTQAYSGRRRLLHLLKRCSPSEIMFVGW